MISNFKKIIIALSSALMASSALSSVITVEVQGTGADYRAARADALKEALFRVTGVSVDVNEVSYLSVDSKSRSNGDDRQVQNDIEKSQRQKLEEKANGYIESYDELDRNTGPDGLVNVLFRVSVYRYDMPGINDTRRSISVLGIMSPTGICLSNKVEGEKVAEAVSQGLLNAFRSTRKFAVLDRGSAGLEQEEAFIRNKGAGREIAKLGLARGADYVVSGNVGAFKVSESTRTIKLTGDVLKSRQATLDAQLNLMLLASREVKFSRKVNVKLNDEELRELACNQILDLLSIKAAQQMVGPAILSIYPPMITSVQGNTFTVNYGEGDIARETIYNVFSMGEKMYDPYTKESLGRIETLMGKARAVDVKPKYTIFEIIEGKPEDLKVGCVVRPNNEEKTKKTTIKKGSKSILKSKMDDAW